ncbi:hypothetical protein DRP77_04800 [Candidatus Poribacteria bacterium]|nr:MAG: hypothetical protein DRP77_04800 [Candidatus Poribacteria bacterium]
MYQNEGTMISGAAITILNASEVASIEIPGQTALMPSANGWNLVVQEDTRMTVTFKTGARRLEIQLSAGDEIYRDHQDIIISRKQPVSERRYRPMTTAAAQTQRSYTPPDYSELIQQVREQVMRDLEERLGRSQPQPGETEGQGG